MGDYLTMSTLGCFSRGRVEWLKVKCYMDMLILCKTRLPCKFSKITKEKFVFKYCHEKKKHLIPIQENIIKTFKIKNFQLSMEKARWQLPSSPSLCTFENGWLRRLNTFPTLLPYLCWLVTFHQIAFKLFWPSYNNLF